MHNIIYFLKNKEKGTGCTATYLQQTYPVSFCAYDYSKEDIPNINRIWRIQNPFLYKYSCIDRANDIIMIRKEFCNKFPGRHLVDGYSYYRNSISKYDGWFPTVYQSNFGCNSLPSIGYYARSCRNESNLAFIDFIKSIPEDIPVVTMGTLEYIQKSLIGRANWRHVYDNDEFWKSCSHYFYYRCSDFEDPFPQNLLEAIQSKHRIISPIDCKRNFKDGIDDFLSCLDEYDDAFIENATGIDCECLNSKTWKKFIENLEKTDFQRQSIIYNQNSTFYDWICKKLR